MGRDGEIEKLRLLLERLSREDRPAFDAVMRLILRTLPSGYTDVDKS